MTIPVVLLGWCLAVPAAAQDNANKPAPGETADRLQKIERNQADYDKVLRELTQQLSDIKEALRHHRAGEPADLKGIKEDVANLKPLGGEVAQLKAAMTQLQEEVNRLKDSSRVQVTPRAPVADGAAKPVEVTNADLIRRLEAIERKLDVGGDLVLQAQTNARDITALKGEVTQIRTDLARLQDGVRAGTGAPRTSMSINPPPAGGLATGRVRLVNRWMDPVTVLMDGASYQLAPGETRLVTKPAGSFQYEVLTVSRANGEVVTAKARTLSTVEANQVVTIDIHAPGL
jgi:uncharacterized coiled-coil protein SlyX